MRALLIIILCIGFCAISYAEEWAIVGARALGMGGTGVAAARGANAYYWNPALYAAREENDVHMPIGIGLGVEGDLIEKADFLTNRLDTIDLEALQNKFDTAPGTITITDFHNAFEILLIDIPLMSDWGTGLTAHATAGLETRFGNYGVSLMGLAYSGAHPVVNLAASGGMALADDQIMLAFTALGGDYGDHTADLNAIDPYLNTVASNIESAYASVNMDTATTFVWLAATTPDNPQGDSFDINNPTTESILMAIAEATFSNDATPGTYEVMLDNLSGVDIGLVFTQEVAFTASKTFKDNISIGANLKAITANTFQSMVVISQLDDGDSIATEVTDFRSKQITSRGLGIDVGVLYDISPKLSLGLTVRNINEPLFDFENDSNGFTLYSQTRAGLAWFPNEELVIALDLDIMPNNSEVIKGLTTQFLATGLEWSPVSWWSLRTGLYKNIAIGESMVYTGGMGFNISRFYIDFAGSIGFSDVKVDSEFIGMDVYIPERGNFVLSMGFDCQF